MSLHFLRAWFLLGLIPTVLAIFYLKNNCFIASGWQAICDKNLLNALIKQKKTKLRMNHLLLPLLSLCFVWIAASGPAWHKIPKATYKTPCPKMIVLSLSKNMLAQDVSPNRVERAKFIIQDILNTKNIEPVGLIAYTSEPFNVSPLTDDTATINALLPDLNTDTPPVDGENLTEALLYAAKTMEQAKFNSGSILVLTSTAPDDEAILTAKELHQKGFNITIMPIKKSNNVNDNFSAFANAGDGEVLALAKDSVVRWIKTTQNINNTLIKQMKNLPCWQDEGRWFILPAIVLLLPLFQRGRILGIYK